MPWARVVEKGRAPADEYLRERARIFQLTGSDYKYNFNDGTRGA